MNPNILLISDNYEAATIWANGLSHRGMQVVIPESNASIQEALENGMHDMVIIDPYDRESDGIAISRQIRPLIDKPILLFTYEHDERYHLEAYAAGVEECITKPIGIPLFLSKVHAWLQRVRSDRAPRRDENHTVNFQLNLSQRQLTAPDGTVMKLSNLEARLLHLLLCNKGQVLETELIMERVWLDYDRCDPILLKNLVYRLRRKVEPDPSHPRYIQTVAGMGYIFQYS
jgi:DNA-binding response OmpR family regulator